MTRWEREHLVDRWDDADAFERLDAEELAETVPAYCEQCEKWICVCDEEEPEPWRRRRRPLDVRAKSDYV